MVNEIASDDSKTIRILDETFEFVGSASDGYFNTLESPHRDEVLRALAYILSSDDVVLDIGANIGIMSLSLSSLCRGGHVYSFEPGLTAFDYLRRNIATNKAENVEIFNTAIGDSDGTLSFLESIEYGAGSFSLGGSLAGFPRAYDGRLRSYAVPLRSVDSFVAERNIQRLDLLKIDVEGAELSVLSGAVSTLSRFKPRVILELNAANLILYQNKSPLDFIQNLMTIFDEVYWVNRGSGRLYLMQSPEYAINLARYNLFNGFVDNMVCAFAQRSLREAPNFEMPRQQYGLEWVDEELLNKPQASQKEYALLKEQYGKMQANRDYWRRCAEEASQVS